MPRGASKHYYDDHIDLLDRASQFFARKIWHGADKVYARFLKDAPSGVVDTIRRETSVPAVSKHPLLVKLREDQRLSPCPYWFVLGAGPFFDPAEAARRSPTDPLFHAGLFSPGRVNFSGGCADWSGGLTDHAARRDADPKAFLSNLLCGSTNGNHLIGFEMGDKAEILPDVFHDPMARVLMIEGAWVLPLLKGQLPPIVRARFVALQRQERDLMSMFPSRDTRAEVKTLSLADAISSPSVLLSSLERDLGLENATHISTRPLQLDIKRLCTNLEALRDDGLNPTMLKAVSPLLERSAMSDQDTNAA